MPISTRSRRALVLVASLALAATTTVAVAARDDARKEVPQGAPDQAVTANGRIWEMARMGDRIYLRGGFTAIGPYAGSGMPLDPATGDRLEAPLVNGQVSVAVPDGAGGWYLGGDFTQVGDVATRGLAHLDADGNPDPEFTHQVDGLVSALDLADDTLWFGGAFWNVDGHERRHLAAISLETDTVTPFDRAQDLWVTEIAHAEADGDRPARVYVGTDRVTALDPETGDVDPTFESDLRGNVRALLDDGDRILVGGHGLAALDADTGDLVPTFGDPDDQFPNRDDGVVHTLLRDGDRLYVGGDFPDLGGVTGPLVALDADTGVGEVGFTPEISDLTYASSDRGVFDLALAGGRLWAGGSFARVEGEPAGNLVALDPATGARLADAAPAYDNGVNAVDASGDGLYVAGQFFMTDPVHAPGFAALDAETLLPVAEFDAPRSGYGSMVPGDDVLYVSLTNFTGYSQHGTKKDPQWYWPSREDVRAVDPATGARLASLEVRKVKNLAGVTTIGDELFVARRLRNDVKFPRHRVDVWSSVTGEKLRSFVLPLPGYVTELNTVDGRLLAIGSFRRWRPSGQPAHLAAIEVSPRKGKLNPEFDLHTHGPLYEIEVLDGDLFVSGLFNRVDPGTEHVKRPGLAKFDRSPSGFTGLVRAFDPPKSIRNLAVQRMLGLDDTLFVDAWGGHWVDATTGELLPDPTPGYGPQVDSAVLDADGDGLVYAAHVYTPLAGRMYYDLGFVARAD